MLLRCPKPLLLIFLGLAIILTGCSIQSLYQAKEEPKPKDILAKVNYDREKTGVKPNSSTYILPLSDQERSIYHEFSKTKSDLLLKGLSPTEICKLYFHAVKTGDLSTQYALYIKGDEYMGPSYKQFLKDIRSDTAGIENTKLLIEKLEQDVEMVRERGLDSKHAVVEIKSKSGNNDMQFSVIKSSEGVWKAAWMPLQ